MHPHESGIPRSRASAVILTKWKRAWRIRTRNDALLAPREIIDDASENISDVTMSKHNVEHRDGR